MSAIKLTIDAAHWQNEVNRAVKTLEKLTYYFEREQRAILEYAAVPVVNAMQQGAPNKNVRIHIRYPKQKGARSKRGEGQKVATYYPGNLKKSFSILPLRKTKNAVIVGARLAKGMGRGIFGKGRFDAYYLHWVEYGHGDVPARPFVRPAIIRASPQVIRRVQLACNLFAAKFARQNAG